MDPDSGLGLWQLLGAVVLGLCLGGVLALTRVARASLSGTLWALAGCVALWSLGDQAASLAPDLYQKQIALAVMYTGAIFLPAFWWILALRWAKDRGVPAPLDLRFWSRMPLLFAGVMWLVMVTNPWHGHFLVPVVHARNGYGPLWWAMAIPNYLLIGGAIAVELWVLERIKTRTIRIQGAFVIGASGLVLLANLAYVSGAGPHANSTLPVLAAGAVILVVGMFRQGLYDVLPVALPVIASSDPDALLVVGRDGRLVHANPRARALFEALDITRGTRIPEALASRLTQLDGSPVQSAAAGWQDRWWQAVLAPGGALVRFDLGDAMPWLRMSAEPVRGRRGRLLARCLRVHDATDERRAEIEVHRARRLESVVQLSRGVAHDFHNLLTVAKGNADLLASQFRHEPPVQRKLQRILQSCEQAGKLAHQLQLYSGAVQPTRRPVDLSELARRTCEMLEAGAPTLRAEENVDVAFDHAATPHLVDADETQLDQMLLNLLVNARDALAGRNGRIDVSTGRTHFDPARSKCLAIGRDLPAADYVFLRVSDNGAGMDPVTQERIFEPFFSTKSKQRGLGLATVFGVARSHGAPIELESEVGRGTVFTVYFLLAEEAGD